MSASPTQKQLERTEEGKEKSNQRAVLAHGEQRRSGGALLGVCIPPQPPGSHCSPQDAKPLAYLK